MSRRRGPFLLGDEPRFPPAELADEHGLVAIGGSLEPEWLLAAYRQGIFPWPHEGIEPLLWFSPDPRCVLYPGELHVSRRLARTLRSGRFQGSFDTDFEGVMRACAETPRPGQDGTWITEEMVRAYTRLHRMGVAHSCEVRREGRLVGGIYGLGIGRAFFGESMFHRERDASKVAFVSLARHLEAAGYAFLDCQLVTAHLLSLGARPVPRTRYLRELEAAVGASDRPGAWARGLAR